MALLSRQTDWIFHNLPIYLAIYQSIYQSTSQSTNPSANLPLPRNLLHNLLNICQLWFSIDNFFAWMIFSQTRGSQENLLFLYNRVFSKIAGKVGYLSKPLYCYIVYLFSFILQNLAYAQFSSEIFESCAQRGSLPFEVVAQRGERLSGSWY